MALPIRNILRVAAAGRFPIRRPVDFYGRRFSPAIRPCRAPRKPAALAGGPVLPLFSRRRRAVPSLSLGWMPKSTTMASYTPSPILGMLSGKKGSSDFSHNKGGPYIKNIVNPDETSSTARARQWSNWADCAAYWSVHISTIRSDLWDQFGSNWKKNESLGRRYVYTGRDAFMAINSTRLLFGLAIIDYPPDFLGWVSLYDLEMECDTSSGGLFWPAFTNSPLPAGNRLTVSATKPLLTVQKSFSQAYRVVHLSPDPAVTADNIWADYIAAGYSAPVDGQLVSLRLRMVNASYMPGPAQYVQGTFSH